LKTRILIIVPVDTRQDSWLTQIAILFFNAYHNAHKAAMKNPRVSEEAKKHAQQKLSEIKSQGHTSEAEARSTRYRESQQQNVANQEVAGEAVGEEEEEEPEMVEGEEGEVSEEEE
jgi:hypothetical protein